MVGGFPCIWGMEETGGWKITLEFDAFFYDSCIVIIFAGLSDGVFFVVSLITILGSLLAKSLGS